MTHQPGTFRLPGTIDSLLDTLSSIYQTKGERLLHDIVTEGIISVEEGVDYDNLDGGIDGHRLVLAISRDLFIRAYDDKAKIERRITEDLNGLNHIPHEWISCMSLIQDHAEGQAMRTSPAGPASAGNQPRIPSAALHRIWGSGGARVFISHKSTIKEEAAQFKEALAKLNISAFVAHEDIEPTEEWRQEIEYALFSMDVLVALVTPDFHESLWTNQEVGVALGRQVPVVPIRLGNDPRGFIGKSQALCGCDLSNPKTMTKKVFGILCKRIANRDELFNGVLSVYAHSGSCRFSEKVIEEYLSVFEALTEGQVDQVLSAFNSNRQNKEAFRGKQLLIPLLEKWTRRSWKEEGGNLLPVKVNASEEAQEEDIPF